MLLLPIAKTPETVVSSLYKRRISAFRRSAPLGAQNLVRHLLALERPGGLREKTLRVPACAADDRLQVLKVSFGFGPRTPQVCYGE
jgi:hypothetical protein